MFGKIFDHGRKDFLNDTHRYFALLFELCCKKKKNSLWKNSMKCFSRMAICGHRLNRYVLNRQCKDYFLQHQLVQQILILEYSPHPHYHSHQFVGHFHQHLLILISIHQYGRRIRILLHHHLNINHVSIVIRLIFLMENIFVLELLSLCK